MQGTVTMDSINNLVFNISPMLKKKYKGEIKIFLIGKFFDRLPINIIKEINQLGIFENIGHVRPINKILSKCHAILVCNEINLGVRVRILTAMAEGVPIITHSSNTLGIPELKNNYNCLIGNNSKQLLNACDIIFKNIYIANIIAKNAYTTYKKLFSIQNFKHYLINN
jgi:glycosyltransferase involved in cell wall biosynthesis